MVGRKDERVAGDVEEMVDVPAVEAVDLGLGKSSKASAESTTRRS